MKKFKFTIKGHNYDVEIKKFEENIASIEVNGTPYKVEVHKEIMATKTPTLIRKKPANQKENIPLKTAIPLSTVKAPLPGSIIQVLVKSGDVVKKGQNLLIMEAMKMENNVLAEKDGIIKNIRIKVGDIVLQNDVLIEIE